MLLKSRLFRSPPLSPILQSLSPHFLLAITVAPEQRWLVPAMPRDTWSP